MGNKKEKTADIIDLDTVRKAKMTGSELDNELSERIERIKQSIERINKLMAELRNGNFPNNNNE
jgi:hypothetical protein